VFKVSKVESQMTAYTRTGEDVKQYRGVSSWTSGQPEEASRRWAPKRILTPTVWLKISTGWFVEYVEYVEQLSRTFLEF
jgi:hypothetical protein